jgi:ribosomal protein L31E
VIYLAETKESLTERIYTIPLRRKWLKVSRNRRAKKAVDTIKAFLSRHMHVADVKLSPKLNEKIWERSAQNPPPRIKVLVKEDEKGVVTARLPDESETKKEEKHETKKS